MPCIGNLPFQFIINATAILLRSRQCTRGCKLCCCWLHCVLPSRQLGMLLPTNLVHRPCLSCGYNNNMHTQQTGSQLVYQVSDRLAWRQLIEPVRTWLGPSPDWRLFKYNDDGEQIDSGHLGRQTPSPTLSDPAVLHERCAALCSAGSTIQSADTGSRMKAWMRSAMQLNGLGTWVYRYTMSCKRKTSCLNS